MKKTFDISAIIVIAITFVLFVIALFVKGFTHDLLLEVAVFMVSLKLIMIGRKNSYYTESIKQDLDDIREIIKTGQGGLGLR